MRQGSGQHATEQHEACFSIKPRNTQKSREIHRKKVLKFRNGRVYLLFNSLYEFIDLKESSR